jgi:hypothetical protein
MGFAMPATAKQSSTVKVGGGYAIGRQHDLGAGIYHFAPNTLLPLIWAGAGNKAEFASSTVSIAVGKESLRMAVALIPGVGLNPQLDCNEPCPMPTSVCIASFNTVTAGFSAADCVAGFAAMTADIAASWMSSKIAGGACSKIAGILGKSALGIQTMLVVGVAESAVPNSTEVVSQVAKLLMGWILGSPLGYSPGWAPGGKYGGSLNDAISDLISPAPAPPSPSSPPSFPKNRTPR